MPKLGGTMAGVRLTSPERQLLARAAAHDGLPLAPMMRRASLREARRILSRLKKSDDSDEGATR